MEDSFADVGDISGNFSRIQKPTFYVFYKIKMG